VNAIVLTAHCPAGHAQTIRVLGGAGAALLANMLADKVEREPERRCATCGQPMGPFAIDVGASNLPPSNGAALGK
jgi:hypothetical protein